MSRVFVDVGMTLDGCIAGPNAHPGNPMGDGARRMHEWLFRTATFLEMLKLPAAGDARDAGGDSRDEALVREVFARAGAYVMGRRMFDEGEVSWPEEAPFHAPVFVLTHSPRAPWARPGGTTFHFVTDGMLAALERARAVAAGRDVRISGGAATVREFLAAGLVDEITIHVAPLVLGAGVRLFDGLAADSLELELLETIGSPLVTHLRYRVSRPGAVSR